MRAVSIGVAVSVLLAVLLAVVPVDLAVAGTTNNRDHLLDGKYTATVINKVTKKEYKKVSVELEGYYASFTVDDKPYKLKAYDIFDRHYVLELTCSDSETGHTWVLKLDT